MKHDKPETKLGNKNELYCSFKNTLWPQSWCHPSLPWSFVTNTLQLPIFARQTLRVRSPLKSSQLHFYFTWCFVDGAL